MIIEITKDNIEELENTFFNKEELISEFDNNPFAKVLALKEEDVVIGYIYYSDIYDRLEINQFEINKEYRNQGKGKYLIQYLIDKEKKDITLEVKQDNYSAIKVYEAKGFIQKAVRKGYYNGIDGLLMERKYEDSSRK
ncbi:MAG: GNAT family N-acetyltransferase [Bacilli bacterium]|nr:GNAT family N-acetyltransferase [Bacilli bacterium]